MEMPERRQRKPDPGSPNVQTRPATDPAPDPRPNLNLPPRSSWKRRPVVQWITLGTLLLTITVGAAENVPVEKAKPTINICESPECKKLDSAVEFKMNQWLDPCDDFYKYACGGFIQHNWIPRGKMKVTTLTKAEDRLEDEVSALISDPKIRANDTSPIILAKYLYQQCTITPETNPMLSMLTKLGGWNLLEKGGQAQPEPSWSLVKSVDDLRSHGYTNDYFIRPSVEPDWKNTSRRMIYIDQATLGVNRENLARGKEDPFVSDYYDYMVNVTEWLGADQVRAKQNLLQSLEFEIALANISLNYKTRKYASILYNTRTVQELQGEYPYINWLDYFRVVFKDTGIVIDKNETVIVKSPRYFNQLGTLLQTTSNRTLVNYVMWRVVDFSSSILNVNLHNERKIYLSAKEEEHRALKCVEITKRHLPIAVAAQYVKEHVDADSRRVALEMAYELRNAFVEILNENDWMDNTARNSCVEKVNSMAFHIGYPDELLDDRKIIDYYCDLERKVWSTKDYLGTVLYIQQFNRMKNFKILRKPVDKTDWTTHSKQADFLAWYSSFENSVQMATGLLQVLFLPHDLPRYMNYGTIGTVIGRLITEACDYLGREWDKNGNPENWWQLDTERAFVDKRRCFIDQYYDYTEPNTNRRLNGFSTVDENIADHGGLKVAYRAYKKWAGKNGSDPRLPDLKLSPDRMFWLSAAQARCSVYRAAEMNNLITLGPFSPDQFRVLGAMENMVEFSEDFNCPSSSVMNRTEKCKVW